MASKSNPPPVPVATATNDVKAEAKDSPKKSHPSIPGTPRNCCVSTNEFAIAVVKKVLIYCRRSEEKICLTQNDPTKQLLISKLFSTQENWPC